MKGLSCAVKGPAAPINYALVMDPISRLPEIYFIKNYNRDRGHRRGDSRVAARLERDQGGLEKDRGDRKWEGEGEQESAGGGGGESKALA